jgi:hypothetical protein
MGLCLASSLQKHPPNKANPIENIGLHPARKFRGEYRQAAGAVTQAGYLVPVSLNHILILINDL